MKPCLRPAGCPAAERKILTEPTGGASPGFTPWGVESLLAQLRHPGRAVPLRRRRQVRDDFLGREGRPSQSPFRKARRQTLNTCLVQPAREVDARFLNESLAPVSRASSATTFEKNWIIQSPSGVRPLDFRTDTPRSGHAINKERAPEPPAVLSLLSKMMAVCHGSSWYWCLDSVRVHPFSSMSQGS
jgi:hypothetical protein